MGIRTVRLDDKTERMLEEIRDATGLTISEVLKRGVQAYAEQTEAALSRRPYDVFRRIELGEGGWAVAPAHDAKRSMRETIARKHRR